MERHSPTLSPRRLPVQVWSPMPVPVPLFKPSLPPSLYQTFLAAPLPRQSPLAVTKQVPPVIKAYTLPVTKTGSQDVTKHRSKLHAMCGSVTCELYLAGMGDCCSSVSGMAGSPTAAAAAFFPLAAALGLALLQHPAATVRQLRTEQRCSLST